MPKLHILPDQRRSALSHRRHLKMASSAHAYVRGNTVQFYEWLAKSAASKSIPAGPSIWICGDCHVGNLGPVADLEGKIEIEIRDLDQTVIGNPAHDLLRMGLSLAMSGRGSDLPGVTTALMIEAMLDGYLAAMAGRRTDVQTLAEEVAPIAKVMREALNRKWRHLAKERIEDVTPTIPMGRRFWPLSDEERTGLTALFAEDGAARQLECLHTGVDSKTPIRMLDAAYWMKGCSSLGRLRFAVLVGVGRKKNMKYRLIDIKEAIAPAAPCDESVVMPKSNGERVVTGACALAPFLGGRMLATSFAGRDVFLRELRPQDLKFELDELTQEEAILTARLLGGVVGKAHARQMTREMRVSWAGRLTSRHSRDLSAPGWLWNAVVELVADHEAAYLQHCRRYALEQAAG